MYRVIIILMLLAPSALCQVIKSNTSDSLEFASSARYEPINKEIEGLAENEGISQFENKYGLKAVNIIGCIDFLSLDLTQEEKLLLSERLKEIAIKLVEQKQPLIIFNTGHNSVQHAEELNAIPNEYGITYISLGNSCIDNDSEELGIRIFNEQTMNSLGIEMQGEKSQQLTTNKRKRNKKKR